MELKEILELESTNHRYIYLYNYKGLLWGCCGCSALLLHRLYPNISFRNRDVSGKGDVLPVMIIDRMTWADLIDRLPPIKREEDSMVFDTEAQRPCLSYQRNICQ